MVRNDYLRIRDFSSQIYPNSCKICLDLQEPCKKRLFLSELSDLCEIHRFCAKFEKVERFLQKMSDSVTKEVLNKEYFEQTWIDLRRKLPETAFQ